MKHKKKTCSRPTGEIKALRARIKEFKKIKTGKIEAEDRLRKQENFLLSVFGSIQDGISVLDKKMRIVLVNPTMEQWYKHAMPLAGKKCYEAYHCRKTPCDVCPTRRTLRESGAAHDIVPKTGPGGVMAGWLDLYSYPLIDVKTKKLIGVIEYTRDITEQKKAEKEVEEAVMRLVAVIERIDEGITLSDANGHFIIYNSKMGDITGYSMEEANTNINFIKLLYSDPKERDMAMERIGEVVKKGGVRDIETAIRAKDGTDKTLLVSTSLLQQNGDKMFLSVYRDISERKKIEQLKDEFIGTVSHELRTPLSIVKEGINVILDGIPGKINEQQAKVLTSAKVNIDRLTRVINNLLDISKIEAGKVEARKEYFGLNGLLRQTLVYFEAKVKGKGLEIRTDLPEKEINVYADPDMVVQVVTNLVDNSIRFTKEGHIELSVRDMGGKTECAVSDTGIGISKTDLPRVFGKFQQLDRVSGPGEKGTGLGLSIAKKLVEMQGGDIRIESVRGKGTKVIFTLQKNP